MCAGMYTSYKTESINASVPIHIASVEISLSLSLSIIFIKYMLVPKCALSQFANWDPSLRTEIHLSQFAHWAPVPKLGSQFAH